MPARKLAKLPVQPLQLSLHIRHPSIDPRTISAELQLEADEAFAAGTRRQSASDVAGTASVHQETCWAAVMDVEYFGALFGSMAKLLAAARAEHASEAFVSLACGRLFAKHRDFARKIRDEGGSLTLVATIYGSAPCAFKFTPELARQVSELGITIKIELAGD